MKHAWKSVAAVAVLALAACSQEASQDADNAFDAAQNALTNTAEATGNVLGNAAQALMPTPSPQEFADRAARSDAFEIAAGELAATNAASADVKEFAQTMVAAHKESTQTVKTAASAATPAITPNATLTADQQGDLRELRGLKGADFDKAYIDGQVDAHEDALALMRKYAADGDVASLKAAAQSIVPVVEQHLDHARTLERALDAG